MLSKLSDSFLTGKNNLTSGVREMVSGLRSVGGLHTPGARERLAALFNRYGDLLEPREKDFIGAFVEKGHLRDFVPNRYPASYANGVVKQAIKKMEAVAEIPDQVSNGTARSTLKWWPAVRKLQELDGKRSWAFASLLPEENLFVSRVLSGKSRDVVEQLSNLSSDASLRKLRQITTRVEEASYPEFSTKEIARMQSWFDPTIQPAKDGADE